MYEGPYKRFQRMTPRNNPAVAASSQGAKILPQRDVDDPVELALGRPPRLIVSLGNGAVHDRLIRRT